MGHAQSMPQDKLVSQELCIEVDLIPGILTCCSDAGCRALSCSEHSGLRPGCNAGE